MSDFFKSNIKIKISLGFLLAFLAFASVQFLSNKSLENLRNSEIKMRKSLDLSKRIESVQLAIQVYNSKINSFVLTGNKIFLSGNEVNLGEADKNIEFIKNLVTYPNQIQLVNQLDSLVNEEINFNQQALIAYDKNYSGDVIAHLNTGKGKTLLNEITLVCENLQKLEEMTLNNIISNNESFSRKVSQMDYAATAFALIVILFSISVLFRDVNKRTKIERQLRLAQTQAEQSAILKEQFMANMSHEIRTPMNAIIGFTNLLFKTKLDDKQNHHVLAIQSSGENLLTIINDILDFSKIEAGMLRIEETSFSPAALLHSMYIMFLPKAKEKNINLIFNTSQNLENEIIGDPTRLTQILVNLIGNAIKFTKEGSITVNTQLINNKNEKANLQISVKDTGIGIEEEKISKIFERFIQASSDTSRKFGGSGLGLSIVKKLVEIQGGEIHVDSVPDVGSNFTFSIPYKISSGALAVNSADHFRTLPKLDINFTILVAEDNLLNQRLMQALLSDWGFDFEIVENGLSVIEKLKSKNFDLLLLDIQMPEMNGYETVQHIRQKLNLNIPIVAMTAHALPGEKEKCISYGMNEYISKPIRENQLYDQLIKYAKLSLREENNKKKIAESASTIVNLNYLNDLSNGNQAFVTEMKNLFINENPKEINLLENAISNEDFGRIRDIAHKIKSTIPFVGLNLILDNELTTIEDLAEKKININQIKNLFSFIKSTCLRAADELNELKSNHA